jgi:type IV secretory pathway VirB2 component (pilin)
MLRRVPPLIIAVSSLLYSRAVYAASTGMPWETPLGKVASSLSGPTAKFVGLIAIVVMGLGWWLGGGLQKLFAVGFGLCIAFNAQVFLDVLGFSGGLTL